MSVQPAAAAETRPGRTCPLSYRYSPRAFDREPQLEAETLYVIGGLYGNVEALAALAALAAQEPGPVTLAFNGDFRWFDVDDADFAFVTRIGVRRHAGPQRLYGLEAGGAHVEALRVDYDQERWLERFLAAWPANTPAHESYFRRISQGARFVLSRALPKAA